MKLKDLQTLGDDELILKQKEFKKNLFELNYQKRIGQLEKPSQFKNLRRCIAQILTILKERELKNERSTKAKK